MAKARDLGKVLASILPRAFILEFEDGVRAAGSRSRAMLRDVALGDRNRARMTGQLRTAMAEEVLVQSGRHAGFPSKDAGAVDGTTLFIHQSYAKVGRAVVVRATIAQPGTIPSANQSRKRLAEHLNWRYCRTKDLFRDAGHGDFPIAVFLLVCPNRHMADGIGELAVAVVDHLYSELAFYETFDRFLQRYSPKPAIVQEPAILTRKKVPIFKAPEEGSAEEPGTTNKETS